MWKSIKQFAEDYEITTSAVRDRIRRGTLKTRKGYRKVEITEVYDKVMKTGLATNSLKKKK